MSRKSYNYERCIVHLIVEKMNKNGVKHKPAAIKAWPHLGTPDVAWRSIRNAKKTKPPQRLTINDAAALCEVIEESFPEIVLEAKIKIENGWDHADHEASPY